MAQILADEAGVERDGRPRLPGARGEGRPLGQGIGAEAEIAPGAAAEAGKPEIRRDLEKQPGISAAPRQERRFDLERREGLERAAEERAFEVAAEASQAGEDPHPLGRAGRAGDAARLDGQRVRPFPGQKPEDVEEIRPRGHRLALRAALHRREAGQRAPVPAPTGIGGAGEVRHEEEVEMGQVIGRILDRMDQRRHPLARRCRRETHRRAERARCRDRLADRADPADPRRDGQCVAGIAALEHALEAAVERRIHPRRRHSALRHLQMNLEIPLDPVERADHQPRHRFGIRSVGGTSIRSEAAFRRMRSGVAALDRLASAMNQAFGMSEGRPTGMPPILGVSE